MVVGPQLDPLECGTPIFCIFYGIISVIFLFAVYSNIKGMVFVAKTIQFNAFLECFNFREHEIREAAMHIMSKLSNCHNTDQGKKKKTANLL